MPKKSTQSPSGSSFFPPNDQATYRDLLLFEERLKTNALILNRRKSRYQCMSHLLLAKSSYTYNFACSLSRSVDIRHHLPALRGPAGYIIPLSPLPVPPSPCTSKRLWTGCQRPPTSICRIRTPLRFRNYFTPLLRNWPILRKDRLR
jgi:hypothetical protein